MTPSSPTVLGSDLTYAGSAGKSIVVISGTACQWARLKYTDTSGSATVKAFACTDAL